MSETEEQAKTHAQRQQSYHQRMREKGMVRVSAWIPDDDDARADFWEQFEILEGRWRKRGLPTVSS